MVESSRTPAAMAWALRHPVGPARPGWSLRQLPRSAVALVLAVQLAAVVLVVSAVGTTDWDRAGLAALIGALSLAHTELAIGIERARRRATETSYSDLSSVWTFAAAALLPPALTAAVIGVVYLHLWHRVWRPAGVPAHRHAYATATVVLAAAAAHAVVGGSVPTAADDLAGVAAVGAAVLVYLAVNTLLVAAVIALAGVRPVLRELTGRRDDSTVELAALCLGALAAVALASTPGLVLLVLPPILVLHRAVLVRQLEEAATTDAKTGLLTASAWRARADQAVRRVRRTRGAAAVLILDLDHFKLVNDVHGHLAGDGVLAAVAAELRAGVRQGDVVGRFGGEEFLVLLPDLPAGASGRIELSRVAERLRGLVADLRVPVPGGPAISGLTVSIGGAMLPLDGTDLDQVLRAADASLYAAKRDGRNLVRIAGPPGVPSPRRPLL
ncbi:GGDEF domain-containing protein [Pseudonocardia humida]|uniref:GGDEF domain-containing protein n=1 Tax=Pseudonocardia humida TaxID=2800819 RepID=A0ABT0ZYZ9_9PSEU|nr:GGDEF domain-containing protein [Pseudonocardia humida]MCO1655975.1 GGDEF domain-containing protein [Pseudonocardia humida]